MEAQGTILECGHTATEPHHEFTTGYGVDKDGKVWSFRQVGDNTQIAHCKRLKG